MERHGKFDKEFKSLEILKNYEVQCIFWEFGEIKGYRGTLLDIDPYNHIRLEGLSPLDFVGQRLAIEYILFQDQFVIYSNPAVEHYKGCLTDLGEHIKNQKDLLGYSVREEESHQTLNQRNVR